MTTLINTAYGTPTSYLTTELNSLASAGVVLGAAINNSTNRHICLKAEIYIAAIDTSAQTAPAVQIRLIESLDGGTTYVDNDSQSYALTVPIAPGTGSVEKRKISGEIMIPPGYFKLAIVNGTGVQFASSGNVVKYVTYTPETA